MHGQQVCGKHGGKASQNLRKAEERLATHADVLMKELLHIATSAESEAVRLAAVRDALDRIGIGSKRELEVTMAPWEVAISGILVDGPDDELDTIDGEVVEEVRAIPPSDLADQDKLPALTDDPPHYSRGNRLRGR